MLRWLALGIATTALLLVTADARAQQPDPATELRFEWALHWRTRDSLEAALNKILRERESLQAQVHEAEDRLTWVLRNCRNEGCW